MPASARPAAAFLNPAGLDPQVAAALVDLPPTLDAACGVEAFTLTADQRRWPVDGRAGIRSTAQRVPGLAGQPDVEVRTYRRWQRTSGAGRGVLVLHGGGFISGSPALADPVLQDIAEMLDAVVVAPTYRLAPANPHPAAFNDCRAVLEWMGGLAADLGIDSTRLVVFGVSSGGCLAAALALAARDAGGPPIALQVLGFPVTDDRLTTVSSQSISDPRVWNGGMARLSWQAYLGDRFGTDDVPATAAPARAKDLSGLPPAVITVNQHDPLRDEGLAYAQRLIRAGVRTDLHHMAGTFHGSMGFVPDARISRHEMAVLLAAIARA